MSECQGKRTFPVNIDKNYCRFIETLSFGSDISIKCNSTYLTFNEINSETSNWKFANQTSICKQKGIQQAEINQCGVKRFGANYLKVPLLSSHLREKACIYCRIDYKPIAPLISVTQSDHRETTLYTINITATGLDLHESFEIVWAKRVNDEIRYSYNYWFISKCIHRSIKILENTGHTILFAIDDSPLSRIEFILRRCRGSCRTYDKCDDDDFNNEVNLNYGKIPDSIEKLSCDFDCLAGSISTPLSTETSVKNISHEIKYNSSYSTNLSSKISSTNYTPSNEESKIIVITILSIGGLLLTIPLVIFLIYIICKRKEKHMYAKTSNNDPDGQK
ncbi:hypothetical protein I4U23_028943 [Adineta vaga]|nr:hypothetical protein I4U23_028943 [Adineta vaga]